MPFVVWFRGSVVALNPTTGAERWRRYTIAETPKKTGENAMGNPTFGPSGATIWSAPTYDPILGVIYVGTSENASNPATKTSDAILAIDVKTSEIKWSYQGLAGDAWNMSCGTADRTNCPEAPAGLDYDMGSSPSLATMENGKRTVWFINRRAKVWRCACTRSGRWRMAASYCGNVR